MPTITTPIDSVSIAIADGDAVDVDTRAVVVAGSDGTDARFIKTGADGTVKTDSSAHVQPVSGSVSAAVSGTVTANLGTIGGAATESTLSALNDSIQDISRHQDQAALSGDKGIMALVVRSDAGGNLTSQDGDYAALQVNATGGLRVDGSAATQPVSGTVTANAGSGTFAVSAAALPLPSGAASESTLSTINSKVTAVNTGAVVVSSSALPSGASTETTLAALNTKVTAVNTGAVVVSSSSLPSGAATAAKQPALGTAGTASADVITVQGVASMTAIKTDSSATTQPVSGTIAATQSGTWTVQPGNTANTTAWKVDGSATTQPISGTVTANAGSGTFAVSAAALPLPSGAATETTLGGVLTTSAFQARINTLGAKTSANSAPVVLASDQAALPITDNSGSLTVDNGGTFAVQAAQSGTWSVNTKSALTASSPTAASVGVASAQAVASNANRKGLVLTNTSANTISLGLAATAVLNSGITLPPGSVFVMDEFTFATGAVNAIASGASSNMAIQEFS